MKTFFAWLLALTLAVAGLGMPPAYANPVHPWDVPGDNLFDPPDVWDTTEREYEYRHVDAQDYDVPEWMLDPDYLDALPIHHIYKEKDPARARQSAGFRAAYARYVREMARHQGGAPVSEQVFWESFFPCGWNHFLTAWRDYRASGRTKSLADYRKVYVDPLNKSQKGSAFEVLYKGDNAVDAAHGFTVSNGKIPGYELPVNPKTGKAPGYRVDAYLPTWEEIVRLILELKSGKTVDRKEFRKVTMVLAADANADIYVGFGEMPTPETMKFLVRMEKSLRDARIERWGADKVGARVIHAFLYAAVGKPVKPAIVSAMAPGGQTAGASPAQEAIDNSPPSAEYAADTQRIVEELTAELAEAAEPESGGAVRAGQTAVALAGPALAAPAPAAPEGAAAGYDGDAGADPEQLGGVDFSTLELRYVSDTYDGGLGSGLRYAYQVEPDPGQEVSYGGKASAQLAADAFFTWLVLPPRSFTVNLNPDQPNDIMDAELGRTEAGRVLLDADFQMKKTIAKMIHPDAEIGKEFWSEVKGESPCISMRQWIVPRPAVVREQGNELFIVDAPLEVKMETEYIRTKGKGSEGCPNRSTRDTAHNESVYRVVVLAELQKAVNTAPEYADLRRVYASRVAAEWYRKRSATKKTAYGHLVDSGDASAWPLRAKWTPKDTWNRFVKSYKEGEFRVERTTQEGTMAVTRLYVYGGVDFSKIPERKLSTADFAGKRPAMGAAVEAAMAAPFAEAGGAMWLGGWSTERPEWAARPAPESPLGRPVFWAATTAPMLAWLIAVGLVLANRRRRAAR